MDVLRRLMTLPFAIAAGVLAALTATDSVQLFGIAVLLSGAIVVGRGKAKDETIKTWRENAEAECARADRLEADMAGCVERADREHERRQEAENRVARLEGQLEELRPYGQAFKEITDTLTRVESVLGTSQAQLGELVLQSSSLVAGQTKTLEKIADDLSRLAEKLGALGDRPIGSA